MEGSEHVTEQPDSGLGCVVLMARLHGVACDGAQLAHQFARSAQVFDLATIVRALRSLELKARTFESDLTSLARGRPPLIAGLRDGGWLVLARVGAESVLVQDPREARPRELTRADFERAWSGEVVLVTRRAGIANGLKRFDFSWFLPAILKYRRLLGEVLVASFFLQLLALASPLFFQVVIDKVLVHRGLTTLDVLAIGLLIVSVFEVLLTGLRGYVFSHTTSRIDVTLGADLFRHLLRLPFGYFEARRVGDTVARVRELDTIRGFITGSTLTLAVDLFFTLVFFAVMYLYSPLLTLVVAASVPCYALLAAVVTPVFRARLEERFNRGAENQAFLVETVTGMQTIKSLAVEPHSQRRWEEQLAGYVQASFRSTHLGNLANQGAAFINKLTVVITLWVGAHAVMSRELTVGELVAFNMLAARVSAPILRLVQLWQDLQQAGVSVQRLGDILNAPAEPGHQPGRTSLPTLEGRIAFDDVSFRYAPSAPEVLRRLSFEAAPGEVIGIVGPSGSGKSTVARLLQRLYTPESGRVLVDGVDLAMVDPSWLRSRTSVVLQESFLFNRSVRENIALSDPSLPMDRVVHAAKLAGAHDFIVALPEGYDSVVGEQGSNLSGGQRQRLAIARALVTDPRILIFDEATSALDYETEAVVLRNMRYICRGRTVLIVAHRLNAVRGCDRILVLEDGSIVESGDHAALLARNGYYKRLHAHQDAGVLFAAGAPA